MNGTAPAPAMATTTRAVLRPRPVQFALLVLQRRYDLQHHLDLDHALLTCSERRLKPGCMAACVVNA
jgi:hypothetical protein